MSIKLKFAGMLFSLKSFVSYKRPDETGEKSKPVQLKISTKLLDDLKYITRIS